MNVNLKIIELNKHETPFLINILIVSVEIIVSR